MSETKDTASSLIMVPRDLLYIKFPGTRLCVRDCGTEQFEEHSGIALVREKGKQEEAGEGVEVGCCCNRGFLLPLGSSGGGMPF